MRPLFHALTNPETGFRQHRPLVGWSFAILLGTAFGYCYGGGIAWLCVATLSLVFAWLPIRQRSLWMCIVCCALTAWAASRAHDRNVETWARLQEAQANDVPILLKGTIGADLYIAQSKRGTNSAHFTLMDATFEDGTPVSGVKLRARYYDADGPLPKMGETWQCAANLYKHAWHQTLAFTAYGAPNIDKRPRQVAPPTTADEAESIPRWETPQPMIVSLATREIVQRKRGGPYARYELSAAWLEDGRRVPFTKSRLYYYDASGNFPNAGETWQLWVRTRKTSSPGMLSLTAKVEEGQGPYSVHLAAEDQTKSLRYRLFALRERLSENLALGVSDADALPTQTMTLGATRKLPRDDMQRYADAGILHIFSISGLHVGIIAGLLIWLLSWLRLGLRIRAVLILPALVGYLLLTGAPPSATRACCMACIYCFAPTIYRRSDGTSALFATAALSLLYEPSWIVNVGALLSFIVMGGILLYMCPLTYLFNVLFHSRLRTTAAGEFPEETPWHYRFRRWLALLLGLPLSAWIASIPLLLYFFGRLSLAAIVLNLFIPTLCAVMVWGACVSALAGFLFPALSILLNRFNAFLLKMVDLIADRMTQHPWAVVELNAPISLLSFLLLLLGFLLLGCYLRALEKRLRLADPHDPMHATN